jgi:hypothetical protein
MLVSRTAILSILLAGFCLGAFAGTASVPSAAAPAAVDPLSAYTLCKTISGPEFAGRLTGHPGFTAAAHWAADRFKEWGLTPLPGVPGYLQEFPAPYTEVISAAMTLRLPEGQEPVTWKEVPLEAGKDFLPLLYSDSGDHTGELVFAGWGIHAPDLGYDDFAGIDVKGKFVLCFRGTPDPADKRFTPHDEHRARMAAARDRGALGLIYIYDEVQANPNGDWLQGFTPAEISFAAADRILALKSLTAKSLQEDLKKYKRPLSFDLPAQLRFQVESRHVPDATGYNVIGCVEGSDPELKNECLFVGAHLDHCGTHLGFVYPGANDNASGSAVVMELARVAAALPVKPKRTLVFVLFGSEEKGLQGSQTCAEHLPYGFRAVTAMINLDMVGEGDGGWCGYSAEPAALLAALEAADADSKLLQGKRAIRSVGVRSSDFAPFFLKGIPVVSFSSNGPHVFYHQPQDTIYRINPDMLGDMGGLTLRLALALANQ